MNRGYVHLWRRAFDSGLHKNHKAWVLWTWILAHVTHKPYQQVVGRQLIDLVPGQMVTGRKQLAADLGMTEKQVRTALDRLTIGQNIAISGAKTHSVVTVLNWDFYQDQTPKGANKRAKTGPRQGQDRATNKHKNTRAQEDSKDSCADPSQGEGYAPAATTPDPVAFELPLNITGEVFPITESKIAQLAPLYPAVNVREQIGLALGWLIGNPDKRKTRSGMLRFITSWLAKEQNRGGAQMGLALAQPRATTVHQQKQVEGGQKARLLQEIRRAEDEQGADVEMAPAGGPALPEGPGGCGTGGNGLAVGGRPERVRVY